jgi:AcrR family transcriptional regulator
MPRIPDQATRLLEAAARCFAKQGFRGTTVDDIAAEAGMSRPLLYKHYDGKDALIDAVLDDLLSEWEAQAGELAEYPCATDALQAKLERSVRFAMDRPLLQAIFQQDPRVLMSGHAELFARSNEASRAQIERIVRQGQSTGEFAADLDPSSVTELVELVTLAMSERALGRSGAAVDEKFLTESVKVLLRGLRPRPPHDAGAS